MSPRSVLTLRFQSESGGVIRPTPIATIPMDTAIIRTGTTGPIDIMAMALRTIGTTVIDFTAITVITITTIATNHTVAPKLLELARTRFRASSVLVNQLQTPICRAVLRDLASQILGDLIER